MANTVRTTRTTEMSVTGAVSLGDLEEFVSSCLKDGWTVDAAVTFSTTRADRPGEMTTSTLKVSQTR